MQLWIAAGLFVSLGLAWASPVELLATIANAGLGGGLLLAGLGAGFAIVRSDRARGLVFVALTGLYAITIAWRSATNVHPSNADGDQLTVVSYNVLFQGGDPDATVRVLEAQNADVIVLQEVTPAWVPRLRGLAAHRVLAPHRGTHGLGVLSRYPLGRVRTWPNQAGRAIGQCVDVELPSGPIGVCHVHLASPSGALTQSPDPARAVVALEHNARLRRAQWTRLEAAMRESHRPVAIAGDFNTMPSERLVVDARRRWVDATRHDAWLGAAATWPRLAASSHRPPWPLDRLGPLGPWFRIDYVLVDPALGLRDARRIGGGGSDHFGVRATVRLPRSWDRP